MHQAEKTFGKSIRLSLTIYRRQYHEGPSLVPQ